LSVDGAARQGYRDVYGNRRRTCRKSRLGVAVADLHFSDGSNLVSRLQGNYRIITRTRVQQSAVHDAELRADEPVVDYTFANSNFDVSLASTTWRSAEVSYRSQPIRRRDHADLVPRASTSPAFTTILSARGGPPAASAGRPPPPPARRSASAAGPARMRSAALSAIISTAALMLPLTSPHDRGIHHAQRRCPALELGVDHRDSSRSPPILQVPAVMHRDPVLRYARRCRRGALVVAGREFPAM